MSSIVLSLRAMGERWEVSSGGGLMRYWTLGVHLTEKNLDPGGALLRKITFAAYDGSFMQHIHIFMKQTRGHGGKHLFVRKGERLANMADAPARVSWQVAY